MKTKVKITCRDGRELFAEGKSFDVHGHKFVAHVSINGKRNGWSVTCLETGLSLRMGYDTQREAIAASHALAAKIDARTGAGSFAAQMAMHKERQPVTA